MTEANTQADIKVLYDYKDPNPVPMTKEQTSVMFTEMLGQGSDLSESYTTFLQGELGTSLLEQFLPQVYAKRLEAYGVNITGGLFLLTLLSMRGPGDAVMWAVTFKKMMIDQKLEMVKCTEWSHLFPYGLPSENALMVCWDNQKGHVHGIDADNLMDSPQVISWWN